MYTDLSRSRILVCDDSITNVMILEKLLESEGFQSIEAVTDPRKVAPMLQDKDYDLLLLDIEMPHLNGFEVMEQIQTILPEETFLPILVLTGKQGVETRNQALSNGAHDFVNKPFDQTEVMLRVKNLLRVHHAHQAQANLAHELEEKVVQRTKELSHATELLIHRLALAGEMRDNETAQHVVRVGKYSRILAEAMELPPDICFMIEKTAPMHDIGKIGIPDAILHKQDRLNEQEREVMNSHAEMGAQLLRDHDSLLVQMAATIAESHHEKWDGSGYPKGLKGESIPIEGRITALSDVFDALTTDRPYKKAWSIDEAVARIKQDAGCHFDPALVEKFEKNLGLFQGVMDDYRDVVL